MVQIYELGNNDQFVSRQLSYNQTCSTFYKPIIDILNPVQVSAKEMGNTKRLKEEFGRDLVFWGAACDPQQILSFGTKEQIVDEVQRRIDDLAPQGAFAVINDRLLVLMSKK